MLLRVHKKLSCSLSRRALSAILKLSAIAREEEKKAIVVQFYEKLHFGFVVVALKLSHRKPIVFLSLRLE